VRPSDSLARDEMRLSGVTKPMKKMGRNTIQVPAPCCDVRCACADVERRLRTVAADASLEECAERNWRTGLVSAVVLGMPDSARARVATAIAATASHTHAYLCRLPAIKL